MASTAYGKLDGKLLRITVGSPQEIAPDPVDLASGEHVGQWHRGQYGGEERYHFFSRIFLADFGNRGRPSVTLEQQRAIETRSGGIGPRYATSWDGNPHQIAQAALRLASAA